MVRINFKPTWQEGSTAATVCDCCNFAWMTEKKRLNCIFCHFYWNMTNYHKLWKVKECQFAFCMIRIFGKYSKLPPNIKRTFLWVNGFYRNSSCISNFSSIYSIWFQNFFCQNFTWTFFFACFLKRIRELLPLDCKYSGALSNM